MGDFNFDLLKYQNHLSNEFLEQIDVFKFAVPAHNKTYKTHMSFSNTIDNIFTNRIPESIVNGRFITEISDHLPTFASFS